MFTKGSPVLGETSPSHHQSGTRPKRWRGTRLQGGQARSKPHSVLSRMLRSYTMNGCEDLEHLHHRRLGLRRRCGGPAAGCRRGPRSRHVAVIAQRPEDPRYRCRAGSVRSGHGDRCRYPRCRGRDSLRRLRRAGPSDAWDRINVQGTRRMLGAAQQAGARRFIHIGTEASLVLGQHLRRSVRLFPCPSTAPTRTAGPRPWREHAVRDEYCAGWCVVEATAQP